MNKAEFLQTLQDEQSNWEQFLATVPMTQRQQPDLYGKWSIQDAIGHVAAWERYMTAHLRAFLRKDEATPSEQWGEFVPPDALSDDALNEWMADQLSGRSFDEILGMQREVRAQLIGTVQAIPEARLMAIGVAVPGLPFHANEPLWEVIASMSYRHAQEHQAGLKKVLTLQDQSTGSSAQEQVIQLHQQMLHHWNQRDAKGIAALYTEDATVIGFDGSQMNERSEIENTLAAIFAHHPTATYLGKVRKVRLLSETTATLYAIVGMILPGTSDINPAVNAIQGLVAHKEGSVWRIALFQNTPAQFHGRPEMSEALSEELRGLL